MRMQPSVGWEFGIEWISILDGPRCLIKIERWETGKIIIGILSL